MANPEYTVFGIEQIKVNAIESSGAASTPAGTVYTSNDPQEMSFSPDILKGDVADLRGGDTLVARIEEADKFMGVDLTLTIAKQHPEVIKTIAGGSYITDTESPANIIGWEAPDKDDAPVYFAMTVHVKNYTASDSSVQDGYIKYTFPFCTGQLDKSANKDKEFSVGSFNIKARKNQSTGINAVKWEKVASLVL
jgi:hypothetical protein